MCDPIHSCSTKRAGKEVTTSDRFEDPALFSFEDQFASLVTLAKMRPRTMRLVRQDVEFMRRFCRNEIAPLTLSTDLAIQRDKSRLADEILEKAVQHKLGSRNVPRFLGGTSSGVIWSLNPAMEEAASVEPALLTGVLGGQNLGMAALLFTMNFRVLDWVAKETVRAESAGRSFLLDVAITEPQAGSDMEEIELLPDAKIVTRADPVDGGYVLNGQKCFITGGHQANYHLVVAPTDLRHPAATFSMFLVPSECEGFSLGRAEDKMGHKAGVASELFFRDCFLPDANLVFTARDLPAERRELMLGLVLGLSRISIGALGTGVARGAFELALRESKRVRYRGKALIHHQFAQEILTDMLAAVFQARATYIEATHVLLGALRRDRVPSLLNSPLFRFAYEFPPIRRIRHSRRLQRMALSQVNRIPRSLVQRLQFYSSLAKVSGTDAGMQNCHRALELMGAAGLRHEFGVEKLFRDAKLCQIFEGTNQLNRLNMFNNYIARDVHGLQVF